MNELEYESIWEMDESKNREKEREKERQDTWERKINDKDKDDITYIFKKWPLAFKDL